MTSRTGSQSTASNVAMMTVCLGIAKSRSKGTLVTVEWLFGCLYEF